MTSTSTLRAGLSWFATRLAALALLLLVAGDAQAQRTIFVDANGGSDSNNGTSPTVGGANPLNGPVLTIRRALELARQDGAGNTISIEAGNYDIGDGDLVIENASGSTALNGLNFQARPDQQGNTVVTLDIEDDDFETRVTGFQFSSNGGGTFRLEGDEDGEFDFQSGSVDFGSGVVTFDFEGTIERTNAATTGSVGYTQVPDVLRFNGDNSVTAGPLLPATLAGDVDLEIDLGEAATPLNDNARTFTLGASGLTLANAASNSDVNVIIRDGNTIDGTITIAGTGDANAVDISGEGSIDDLVVVSGAVDYSISESDDADGGDSDTAVDTDNTASSIAVRGGTITFVDDDGGTNDVERYVVTGDFTQTGGFVRTDDDNDTILVVEGDFVRSSNVLNNFGGVAGDGNINVYLEGTEAATFAPGTNLTLNSLHINGTRGASATARKEVTFLQDITVDGGGTDENGPATPGFGDNAEDIPFIVTNDARADLNGNLVNVIGGGESIVDGTIADAGMDTGENGGVRFTNGGIASGSGSYSSILVDGPDISARGNFTFSGVLGLLDGGINIDGATGTDVSPIGPNAAVVVNIEADDSPEINGPFNADNAEYDLSYQDSEEAGTASGNGDQFDVGNEFDTDNIRDLTVDVTNAVVNVDAAADGTISGNVIVRDGTEAGTTGSRAVLRFNDDQDIVVAGSTTIEDDASIDLDDSDTSYSVSTAGNVLDGTIEGDGLLILLNGAAIAGTQTSTTAADGTTARANQSESVISADVRINNGATASITQIRSIEGDITEQGTASATAFGTLTVGLLADSDATSPFGFTQETAGDIDGEINLPFSTLALASNVHVTGEDEGEGSDDGTIRIGTLNTGSSVFFTEADGGGDTDDGPDELILRNDVVGSGAVWPGSDLTISKLGGTAAAPATLVIPVFHPGDESDEDEITVGANTNIVVTQTLRITADLETAGASGSVADRIVVLRPTGDTVANLILDQGYDAAADGTGDIDVDVDGRFNLTTNEVGLVNPQTRAFLRETGIQTFQVNNFAQLQDANDNIQVVNFVTTTGNTPGALLGVAGGGDDDRDGREDPGQLDLRGSQLLVSNDATLASDNALVNTRALGDRMAGGVMNENYSALTFNGADAGVLTITPAANQSAVLWGDGIDLEIAKSDDGTVTLIGGALLFDDEFDGDPIGIDDETLVLSDGTFLAGDPTEPNDVYIRLDHKNSLSAAGSSDEGQGFVFTPNGTQFPDAFIEGNVRKRITSIQSDEPSSRRNPGRVIFPLGAQQDDDEGYAEFVLDFESIAQSQSFGRRNITASFIDESPNMTSVLIGEDADGVREDIEDIEAFYWLVTSDPGLGGGTFFNVEARYDGYELASGTNDGTDENVDELTLVRRQFGDENRNPFFLVSTEYDNFVQADPTNAGDLEPTVVALNVQSFLGPQSTIFTYGSRQVNRVVDNGPGVPVTEFALNGAMPNPFAGRTEISFDLAEAADVSVEVFDVMGRQVLTVNQGGLSAGADHRVALDAGSLASGVYVFRLRAEGASETHVRSGQITLAR